MTKIAGIAGKTIDQINSELEKIKAKLSGTKPDLDQAKADFADARAAHDKKMQAEARQKLDSILGQRQKLKEDMTLLMAVLEDHKRGGQQFSAQLAPSNPPSRPAIEPEAVSSTQDRDEDPEPTRAVE